MSRKTSALTYANAPTDTRWGRKALSLLLSLALCLSLLPGAAFAADTGKAIQLGTGSITGYADTNSYDYIYFGNWAAPDNYTTSGPIKWRVLDDQTNTGTTGLFLLSDGLFGSGERGNVNFDNWRNDVNSKWQFSSAQKWCQDFAGVAGADTNVTDAFTTGELTAILATTKSDAAYDSEVGLFSASENILNGEKVFFLSAEEAEKADYGFTGKDARKAYYGSKDGCWWLRSPYANGADPNKFAGGIHRWGDMAFRYVNALATSFVSQDQIWAARPAFNLDSSSVLFVSQAEGGKNGNELGSLNAVNDYGGSEWKLTLKDSSRSFSAELQSQEGLSAVVSYSGAVTGENEYISAMVTNGDAVKYYGRISAVSQASGTVTVTLPEDFDAAGGDKLSVFNEQYHGDKQTDYASNLVEVSVAAPHEHSWAAEWTSDDSYHWHACTVAGCNATSEKTAHIWGDNGLCTECGRPRGHTHCICGGDVTAGDHESHTEQTFLPWSGGDAGYKNGVAYAYLEQDITLNSNLEVANGNTLYLCLHGNTISSDGTHKIVVKEGSRLVICDCSGGGVIKGATKGWGGTGIYVYQSTLDIFGGKITGGKVAGNGGGGAIALDDKNCVLNIYGGEISGNNGRDSGGAIFLNNNNDGNEVGGGTVNLYGGKICNNTATNGGAIYAGKGGTINLIGGEISGNTSNNDGGAVYGDNGASIKITGTKLTENKGRYGGAVCLVKSCSLVMEKGEMSKNQATEGGAVSVFGNDSTFTFSGGSMTDNSATDGGAVYLNQDNSVLEMSGGKITGNTATRHGGAVYTYRDISTMNMSGGTIENNTAGENGGAIYLNKGQLNLKDAPVIRNNTVSGKANNTYLPTGKTISINGSMTGGAEVGITTQSTDYPVVFSGDNETDYSGHFFADDDNARVEYNSDKKLQLAGGAPSAHTHVWAEAWNSDGTHHWHECTAEGCDITDNSQKDGYAAHSGEDDGNCTTAVTCDTCGYEVKAAQSEHSYPDTWTAVRPGTTHTRKCQNEGCEVVQSKNCTSDGTATCQEFAKCTVCGGEVGTKADHSFTAEVAEEQYLKSAASCTAKAVYYKSCAVCGEKGTETFEFGELAAHDFTAEVAEEQYLKSAASCTAKAVYYKSCAVCGEKGTETFEFGEKDSNNHSGREEWTTTATTHEKMWNCCGAVAVEKEAHEWKEGICEECGYGCEHTGGKATCTEQATCESCGKKYGELAAHDFTAEVAEEQYLKSAASCTAKAVYYKSCAVCGEKGTETFEFGEKDSNNHSGREEWTTTATTHEKMWSCCSKVTVDKAKHSFGEWTVKKQPTFTEEGEREHTCAICDYQETESIPVIDCTLHFETNGGSDISDLHKPYNTTIDLANYEPTRSGYHFTGWYTDEALTDKVTSVQLTGDMTIYAGWKVIVVNPFTDVRQSDWFYDDVQYVYENGLMKGTATDQFSPKMSTTRGMIVTILYRVENEPAVSDNCPFDDVKADAYYEKAITWAATNGIVLGYGHDKFGPEDNITREQMTTILYRYAKYKGIDVSVGEDTNIFSYNDASDVSDYAVLSMQWACSTGLIKGSSGNNLLPKDPATRAQVAAILHRFCESF